MNRLGPGDRETVVKALAVLEPKKAGKVLTAVGRLEDEHALMDWMRHKDGVTAGLSAMETFLREEGPGKPDLEDGSLKVEERVAGDSRTSTGRPVGAEGEDEQRPA